MLQETSKNYFQAFKKIGVNTELTILRLQKTTIIESRIYDHVDFDGISAIVDLSKKVSGPSFTAPKVRTTPEPSGWKKVTELLKWYFKFWPFKASLWKSQGSGKRVSAWAQFPLPPKMTSSRLNTRLLLSLDRTSLPFLRNSKKSRMWMVPVAMYEKIDHTVDGGNQTSFIDVEISKNTNLENLQAQIHKSLKEKSYWGTILTLYLVSVMGIGLFAFYLRSAHLSFRRTGTLTNMGEWIIPGLPQDEWWVFSDGMVALMNPVVATAMVVNGNLGVSVIFHESLGMKEDDARNFLRDWEMEFNRL